MRNLKSSRLISRYKSAFARTALTTVLLTGALIGTLSNAAAQNIAPYANMQALKWRGTVIDASTLMEYYKRERYQNIWTNKSGLTKNGKQLVAVLEDVWLDGLQPLDYISSLPRDLNKLRGDDLAGLELYLSQSAYKLARDLYGGRATASVEDPDIVIPRKKLDLIALLGSMEKNGPLTVIERLRPPHEQYNALREVLVKTADPIKQRQIIVNMERWRWLPRDLGKLHVFVNTAAFLMYTNQNGTEVDRRRVIVGKEYHKTPIFSDNITYSEFNPTWTVTPSIAGNEMLPKLRNDPSYLNKKGYDLYASWKADAPKMNATQIDWSSVSKNRFPHRIVQPAGPDNALGQVKFLFPNKFNVYLHDTANRALFDQSDRALSHGCIRVHKPLEFADLLYKLDDNPARSKLEGIVNSKRTKGVKFQRPIPVHLTYFTTWVKNGKLQTFSDIYKRDRSIGNILFGQI
jgi:murein L,D-transpeptidase YcbB/YkuD